MKAWARVKRPQFWLGAGLLLLLICEVVLRALGFGDPPLMIKDAAIEYYPRSGSYRQFHSRIDINEWGMRGPEVRDPKPSFRILLIGDSIVSGTFRLDQDELVAVSLSRKLAELLPGHARKTHSVVEAPRHNPSSADVEVLNAAADSWGPANQLAYLARVGTFEADAAVWVLSSHDLTDVPVPGAAELLPERPYTLAIQDAVNILHRRLAQADAPAKQASEQSLAAVDALLGLLRDGRVPLVVALHWTQQELSQGELSPYGARLSAHLTSRDVETVSLEPILARTQQPYADSIHLTPAGARAIGEHLAVSVSTLLTTN